MSGNSETKVRSVAHAEPADTDNKRKRHAVAPWAVAAIIIAVIMMIAASLLRASWMDPAIPMPHIGPPWEIAQKVPLRYIVLSIWFSGALGGAGVIAALVALRRGETLPLRTLVVTGLLGLVILTVLPPVGSTDSLDYAVYGHIAALGHSPYVMVPAQYRALTHAKAVPVGWSHIPSVYGPLATFEQFIAAKLSGTSLARTVFWLKVVNAFCFAGVAFAADRLLRNDHAARARAHVLWTANPLLLWNLIAAGHIDLVAAAVGLAGLLIADRWVPGPPLWRALAAGLCVGLAIDVKANYALFLLALCWAFRRQIRELLVAVGGTLLVLVPSYAGSGMAAIKAPVTRAADVTGYGFYGFYGPFLHHLGLNLKYAGIVAGCLLIPVAWLTITRLPAGLSRWSANLVSTSGGSGGSSPLVSTSGQQEAQAVRAALALGLTWLLLWPDQFAWYSVIIICVLVFYPATRIDWLAIAWLTALTVADMPGRGLHPTARLGSLPHELQKQFLQHLAPLVMLVTAIALVVWCINGHWRAQSPGTAGASVPLAASTESSS
jgi:alpha-1,6-mannosyltransferase